MQPIFENYQKNAGAVLCCPRCGFNYLHHTRIEVFERSEDDEKGTHVIVDNDKILVDKNLENNPSMRRDGLKIFFWCEGCSPDDGSLDDIVMTIAQHKGKTLVNIEETSKRCDDGSADT